MRMAGWLVQPQIFADDGENLTPVPVNPLTVSSAEWEAWAAGGWRGSLEQLRMQVEGPQQSEPPADPVATDTPEPDA